MKNIRYYGLDELRAFAALVIVPGHIEQFKGIFGIPTYNWLPIPGKLGVILFFVLSGFLITTLLFKEQQRNLDINLKKFYLRRILRIWPLYFLIIGLSVLVFNQISFLQLPVLSVDVYRQLDLASVMMMIFVLPNFLFFVIPYAAHTWSIGVEEQFYLFQPFLVKFTKNYRILIFILLLIAFSKELVSYFIDDINSRYLQRGLSHLVYFGSIAIGSISAVLYLKQHRLIQLIAYNKFVQISAYSLFLIFLIVIYREKNEQAIDFRIHAIIFAVLVLNVATNPVSVIKLRNRALAYLGKISYGIYMYHPICIGLAIAITRYLFDTSENIAISNTLIYLLTLTLTFFISAMSYKYFEGYFLKFKRRYEV